MNITIKERMLIRKCLGAYVSNQLLDFDKSPLFMELMTKLKEFEKPSPTFVIKKDIEKERKALIKELKKYSYQTITNKKILELIKEERVESTNKQKELIK